MRRVADSPSAECFDLLGAPLTGAPPSLASSSSSSSSSFGASSPSLASSSAFPRALGHGSLLRRSKLPKNKTRRVRFAKEPSILDGMQASVGLWMLSVLVCCAVLLHLHRDSAPDLARSGLDERVRPPQGPNGPFRMRSADGEDDGDAATGEYHRLFATKTRYWRSDTDDDGEDADADHPHAPTGHESVFSGRRSELLRQQQQQQKEQQFIHPMENQLQLVQVQQVNRHGTRFPTKGNIEEIEELLHKLRSQYLELLPEWLRSYKLPYNVSVEGELAATGVAEAAHFGKRTRDLMNTLAPLAFSEDRFVLSHTFKTRTRDSARAFASEFFDNPDQVKYIENPKGHDLLLRFFDLCDRFQRDVLHNPEATIQFQKFKNSSQMQTNLELLQQKLHLPTISNVTVDDVSTVYSACAFDLALYGQQHHWCTLLTKPMLRSMDFADDLVAFYERANGFKLNYEIAAVLLRDVFTFMSDFIAGKHRIIGNFRFAHAETTMPLLALMGVTQDEPKLTADWSLQQIRSRPFRTSAISPFAAHIEFRLYREQLPRRVTTDASGHWVQIVVNEQPVRIQGCHHSKHKYCSLQELQTLWRFYLEDFNFDAYCAL